MKYLEVDEIKTINQMLVSRSGEKFAVWNSNGLEAAVNRHKQYEKVYQIVATLMHSLMNNHCFEAANKRTALIAGQIILEDEGYWFSMNQDKLADRIEQMVKDHWSSERIAQWLRKKITRHRPN